MSKEFFGSSQVPLSPAVRAGDFVFISGQVPVLDGSIVTAALRLKHVRFSIMLRRR